MLGNWVGQFLSKLIFRFGLWECAVYPYNLGGRHNLCSRCLKGSAAAWNLQMKPSVISRGPGLLARYGCSSILWMILILGTPVVPFCPFDLGSPY